MAYLKNEFYTNVLLHHSAVQMLEGVIPNSIPIPYFGNIGEYFASPVRIVTVGLNPSDVEFIARSKQNGMIFEAPAERFNIKGGLATPDGLEENLSRYFEDKPYSGWFSNFEHVLNGANASFYEKPPFGVTKNARALHLDVCSPIATNPTWSVLNCKTRTALTEEGNRIFKSLIVQLKPDILIASVAKHHIAHIFNEFSDFSRWLVHDTIRVKGDGAPRKIKAVYRSIWADTAKWHRMLICWGSPGIKPFQVFLNPDKNIAGKCFLSRWKQEK